MGEFARLEVGSGEQAGVATIRLDRPKMNALNKQVQEEIRAAMDLVRADLEAADAPTPTPTPEPTTVPTDDDGGDDEPGNSDNKGKGNKNDNDDKGKDSGDD